MENKVELNKIGTNTESNTKFCKFCGEKVAIDAMICVKCGRQIEEFKMNIQKPIEQPQQIIINNANTSSSNSTNNIGTTAAGANPKSKQMALILCLFLGWIGDHKFYEGKPLMGFIYLCSFGLFGIGIVLDFLSLLAKPSTYFVN